MNIVALNTLPGKAFCLSCWTPSYAASTGGTLRRFSFGGSGSPRSPSTRYAAWQVGTRRGSTKSGSLRGHGALCCSMACAKDRVGM